MTQQKSCKLKRPDERWQIYHDCGCNVDSIALKDGITCTKCGMIRLHWTDKQ